MAQTKSKSGFRGPAGRPLSRKQKQALLDAAVEAAGRVAAKYALLTRPASPKVQ